MQTIEDKVIVPAEAAEVYLDASQVRRIDLSGGVSPPIVSTTTIPLVLERIKQCESGGRQFNEDGSVLRGKVNSDDIGLFQINLFYHQAKAKELGFDLETIDGNTNYALWLYEHEGTKPWIWSANCWQN